MMLRFYAWMLIPLTTATAVGLSGCAVNRSVSRRDGVPRQGVLKQVEALEEGAANARGNDVTPARRGPDHSTQLLSREPLVSGADTKGMGTTHLVSKASAVIAPQSKATSVAEAAAPMLVEQQDPQLPAENLLKTTAVSIDRDPLQNNAHGTESGPTTAEADSVRLNLPSVLATVNRAHPIVGFARWRVREAYAMLAQSKALWLPSIQAGFSFHRHDGNYQASNGQIVDVNRNSFQYGLGTGAAGAGTTPQPGIVAQFHAADAIFLPRVNQKTAWARGHAADATMNRQLRDAGIAYFDLLGATQNYQIVESSQRRLAELTKITVDFAEAGEGLQADADRMRTELSLLEGQAIAAQESVEVASARLSRVLSLDAGTLLKPMDPSAMPLEFVSTGGDRGALVAMALAQRPELRESQALVAAACDAYQREKYAPFVPSVLLGFSTGGFGGGLSSNLANIDDRYDLDAALTWQVRNLGWGEKAVRNRSSAQVQQARFEKLRLMDQVAEEVSVAASQVDHRKRRLEVTRKAIATAQDSFDRNIERIQDGQGLPLEVLQSLQALEIAQRSYNEAVISYNQAQIQLQWALGWHVDAGQ